MLKSLLVYVVLPAWLIPAETKRISVCVKDDNNLRVDCRIAPKPNRINSYGFSRSQGTTEVHISTNISRGKVQEWFGEFYMEELQPHGFRMTLPGFTDRLPQTTTYTCSVSGIAAAITVQKEKHVRCSAVSLFLTSFWSWIFHLLLFFNQTYT